MDLSEILNCVCTAFIDGKCSLKNGFKLFFVEVGQSYQVSLQDGKGNSVELFKVKYSSIDDDFMNQVASKIESYLKDGKISDSFSPKIRNWDNFDVFISYDYDDILKKNEGSFDYNGVKFDASFHPYEGLIITGSDLGKVYISIGEDGNIYYLVAEKAPKIISASKDLISKKILPELSKKYNK